MKCFDIFLPLWLVKTDLIILNQILLITWMQMHSLFILFSYD